MSKPSQTQQAVHYIITHWNRGKTLAEIAAMYRIDPGNLERAFKQAQGITIKKFVDEKRKEYLIAQIKKERRFGYEIGAELGFADDLAFYRWVRRAFGVSFSKVQSHFGHDKK